MQKRITINVRGRYRDATTTVRAKACCPVDGRDYLLISKRAAKAAADRCCYAGDDYAIFDAPAGYAPFYPCEDGSLRAWKLAA